MGSLQQPVVDGDWFLLIVVAVVVALMVVLIVLTAAPTDPKPKRWFYFPERKEKE